MRVHVKREDIKNIGKLAARGLSANEISDRLEIDKNRVAQFMPKVEAEEEPKPKGKKAKTVAADDELTGDGE